MFTPQQIEQISFSRTTFGGYDMQSVDELLEPLTEDYITLYKENALLKSKMKVLVSKLEEYRSNEASMKDAIVNAQKTCDLMVKEAEAKCTQMLVDANATAMENAKNADAMVAAAYARVDEARKTACTKIDMLKEQIFACINTLDRIKAENSPEGAAAAAFDYDVIENQPKNETDAVAEEISATLQTIIGSTKEAESVSDPKHPKSDTTANKFTNLQFGRNYDPKKR